MKAGRNTKILVVDDEAAARVGLRKLLEQDGFAVIEADGGTAALEQLADGAPDLLVTDLKMPGMDGIELLRALRENHAELPVIVVTAFGDIGSAVTAMRAGANDYLTKPLDYDALLVAIEKALEQRALRAEADNLRRQLREKEGEGLRGLVGASDAMHAIYATARQVASARATVLITGDSGTGKGELARVIHELSPRAQQPFVTVHCASLSETLIESELFGHERGSFTGADKKRIGRFEQADGGTLFLDEAGEIPPSAQVKLLRVLQERTFERVGGTDPLKVDVRLVAATNRDLVADVRDGRFREDLYYRLNVVAIEMPPLRERGADVLLLANHFLQKYARENAKPVTGLSEAARTQIMRHGWPGNVRELENAIERAVVMSSGKLIEPVDLPSDSAPRTASGVRIPGATMADIERHAITSTLEMVGGSTARAAEILDISIRTIQYRLHDYGVIKARE